MVPGEDEAAVKREIADLLALAHERFGVRAEIIDYNATTGGATETALEEPIVQASLAACRAHGIADPGPFGFQGGCDLVHFRELGAQGTVIGPGSLAVAHKPDEFVPVDEFVAASLIYRDVAHAMLRRGLSRARLAASADLHYGDGLVLHTASSGSVPHLRELYLRLDDGDRRHRRGARQHRLSQRPVAEAGDGGAVAAVAGSTGRATGELLATMERWAAVASRRCAR